MYDKILKYFVGYFYVLHSSSRFINLQESSYYHVFASRVENSVNPDQLASEKPADQDLHCFQNQKNQVQSGKGKYLLDRSCNRYSKTCVKRSLEIDKTEIFMTNGSLMTVKSIAECSPWSILQYF